MMTRLSEWEGVPESLLRTGAWNLRELSHLDRRVKGLGKKGPV